MYWKSQLKFSETDYFRSRQTKIRVQTLPVDLNYFWGSVDPGSWAIEGGRSGDRPGQSMNDLWRLGNVIGGEALEWKAIERIGDASVPRAGSQGVADGAGSRSGPGACGSLYVLGGMRRYIEIGPWARSLRFVACDRRMDLEQSL